MGAGSGSGWAAGMRRRRDEMIALGGGQDHDDDHRMSAAELRAALGGLYEAGLRELADEVGIHPGSGFALVALGGLGRREALPHSDLDLLLVHERRPGRDLGELSDSLGYPLWDSGVGLDHSVHTVDRHLVQTAVEASALTTSVARADLLLLSALLHDLGKGRPGDHSVSGAQMAGAVVGRLGLTPADADTTVRVVRHHLLLAATARRDPTDPATVGAVLAALDGDLTALDVLSALTEADSLATGPGVWTAGRAHVHRVLVVAVRDSAGPPAPPVQPPSVPVGRRHGPPDVEVTLTPVARGRGHELTLALPGGGPTLVTVADVLTAVGLDIVDGEIDLRPPGGVRARMTVSTRFGAPVDPAVLRQHLRRAVDGAPPDTLRPALGGDPERAWDTARTVPSVLVHPRTDSAGVLLEARSEDRPGLLGRVLTATLAAGARVDWVVVRTRGAAVEDILALSGPGAVPGTASAVGSVLPGRGPATTPGPPGDTLWGGRRRRPRGQRGPGPRTREL